MFTPPPYSPAMDPIGSVIRLRRYPVKSMLGEDVESSHVTERGLLGDRALAIVDRETGKLASAKRPKMWGTLLSFSASFADPVGAAGLLPPVEITFPDGSVRSSDDPSIEDALTETLGRPVRLAASHDEMQYYEEVWYGSLKDGAEPYGPVIGEEDGEQLIDVPASLAALEGFFDAAAIHLITSASLRSLADAAPGSRFEPERFRPNLVIDVPGVEGFIENDWADRIVEIGDVRVKVLMPVPRCVMTTLPQGDLPEDREVLRTVARTNRTQALGRDYPCAGVYATVEREGEIRVGDPVRLT
jgi:uncharacterized protein YcbX